jgi:hypothetical protein
LEGEKTIMDMSFGKRTNIPGASKILSVLSPSSPIYPKCYTGRPSWIADQIPELTKTTAGQDIKYHVRIELKADEKNRDEIKKKISALLKDVSEKLQF